MDRMMMQEAMLYVKLVDNKVRCNKCPYCGTAIAGVWDGTGSERSDH